MSSTNTYYSSGNFEIENGRVFSSIVDMNNKNRIINVIDPIDNQDAVTKGYVDKNTPLRYNVTLSGTNWSTLESPDLYGSYMIKVQSTEGFPTGIFTLIKSDRTRKGNYKAFDDFDITDTTRLIFEWNPNENIRVRKTSNLCDGEYIIILIP